MNLTMKDVMTANCQIPNAEMLTSNHCAALARELNKLLADALAAQRDEGLARETELRNQLAMAGDAAAKGDAARQAAGGMQMTIDELNQRLAEAEMLSVKHIMLEVIPGEDGIGEEVYAKSTSEIEAVFKKYGDRLEEVSEQRDKLEEQLISLIDKYDLAVAEMQAVIDTGVLTTPEHENLEAEICSRITEYWERPASPGCADGQKS